MDSVVVGVEQFVEAAAQALGVPEGPVTELLGGVVNQAWIVGDADAPATERWVLRTPREARDQGRYDSEAWCAAEAARVGIRTPRVLGWAVLDDDAGPWSGRHVQAQEFVEGVSFAPPNTDRAPVDMWDQLGVWAARLHDVVPTPDAPQGLFTRFGRDVDAAWIAHLDYNDAQLTGDDPLLGLGVITRTDQARLREAIAAVREAHLPQGLAHGDLSPRNALLTDDGPVLIDWGNASFAPVPWSDWLALERQVRSDTSGTTPEGMARLLSAAGVDTEEHADLFGEFRLLQSTDLVRWAIDRAPERIADLAADLRRVLDEADAAGTRTPVAPA